MWKIPVNDPQLLGGEGGEGSHRAGSCWGHGWGHRRGHNWCLQELATSHCRAHGHTRGHCWGCSSHHGAVDVAVQALGEKETLAGHAASRNNRDHLVQKDASSVTLSQRHLRVKRSGTTLD